jgi:hypothetical protein
MQPVSLRSDGCSSTPGTPFGFRWNQRSPSPEYAVNQRDLVPIALMRHFATDEHESFRAPDLSVHRCLMLISREANCICGYLLWTDDEGEVTLRQIYVMPSLRRRGCAEALIRHWVPAYADALGPRFAVEAPNEKSMNLLVKLGLADLNNVARGKCYPVFEM